MPAKSVANRSAALGRCADSLERRLDRLALPLVHAKASTCAVVGSSDLLRVLPDSYGPQIDAHERVWRVNSAPTVGWEQTVGSRTDVRVINHVVTDAMHGRNVEKREELRGSSIVNTLCNEELCVQTDRVRSTRTLSVDDVLRARVVPSCSPKKKSSTGFLAVALALRACEHVHLYGFFSDCCNSSLFPKLNYKYYHNPKSQWVCCAGGREDFEGELASLSTHRRVTIHLAPVPRTPRTPRTAPRCAVVGSASGATLPLPARRSFDRVYLVNHVPHARGLFARQPLVRTLGDSTLRMLAGLEAVEVLAQQAAAASSPSDLCTGRCVFLEKYADASRYRPMSINLLRQARSAGFVHIEHQVATTALLRKQAAHTLSSFRKQKVSGGFATAVLALSECASVEVVGVETTRQSLCCASGKPYSFFGSLSPEQSRAKCCSASRESASEERAWAQLRAEAGERLTIWPVA